MANPFVHIELNTTNVAAAKQFYQQLFDWKLQDHDMGVSGTYTMIDVGGGTGGGIMQHPMPGAPAAATAKAKSLGAELIRDVTEIPGIGSFSIFKDPTGAALALWQQKGK